MTGKNQKILFTSEYIESLLATEEYKPVLRLDKRTLSDEQYQEVKTLESVNSFGQDSIDLFEKMVYKLNDLPTQSLYVRTGLPMMIKHLSQYRPDIEITEIAKQALILRMTRTYMSKVIELHLDCLFKEYLPHVKVRTYSLLDSVMGVDFVVKDDKKRYYVHVTSNTPFAQKMLLEKESRGGYRVGNTYVRYSRDFSGDLILKYDVGRESETTQVINGFPLFKPYYIETRFLIAKKQSSIGEPLSVPYSKLDHFMDWAKTFLNRDITG